jgi:hypothetical protein
MAALTGRCSANSNAEETFMDHTEAIEMHATERYLLGELSSSETAAFEEHYFTCPDCAADVESATALVENAKAVFQEEAAPDRGRLVAQPTRRPSAWGNLLAAFRPRFALATGFATVLLGAICSYQALVSIPRLKEAAYSANSAFVLPAFALAGRARGDEATISIPRDTRSFAVYFDLDPQAGYPEYRYVLKDAAGSVRFALRGHAPAAGQPVTVSVPTRELQPGRYDLVVNGLRGAQEEAGISNFPFILQFN